MQNCSATTYDRRKFDADGLPFCGKGESFFLVRISIAGDPNVIDGIICAENKESAYSLLLADEARRRLKSYSDLVAVTWPIWARRVIREKAIAHLPIVTHLVSQWKADTHVEVDTLVALDDLPLFAGIT